MKGVSSNGRVPPPDNSPNNKMKKMLRNTLAFTSSIIVIYSLFEGKIFSQFRAPILVIPLLSYITMFYLSSMIMLIIPSKLTAALFESFNIAALALFSLLLLQAVKVQSGLELSIIAAGFALSLQLFMRHYSKRAELILRAVTYFALGFLASSFVSLLIGEISNTPPLILIGFAIAGGFSLLGLLKGSKSPRLSAFGRFFDDQLRPGLVGLMTISVMTFSYYSGNLVTGQILNLAIAFGWLMASVVCFVVLHGINGYVGSNSPEQTFGEGHTLVQQLHFNKGGVAIASKYVEDFVYTDRKEGLVEFLSGILSESGASREEIDSSVQDIVRYTPKQIPKFVTWTRKSVKEEERTKRLRITERSIEAASNILRSKYDLPSKRELNHRQSIPSSPSGHRDESREASRKWN